MPYHVKELISDRVCYDKLEGDVSIDETRDGAIEIGQWLDTLNEKKGILLVNVEDMNSFPTNIIAVQKAVRPFLAHDYLQEMVTYGRGDAMVVKFIVNNIVPLFGRSTKLVSNYTQARHYIIEKYPELDESLPDNLD